jgi:hypothetical protein
MAEENPAPVRTGFELDPEIGDGIERPQVATERSRQLSM